MLMCCLYIKQKRYTNAALHVREKCYKSMKKNEQNRTEHVHYLRCLQTLIYIYIYIYMYIINKSTHAIKGSKTLEISQCGGVEATI